MHHASCQFQARSGGTGPAPTPNMSDVPEEEDCGNKTKMVTCKQKCKVFNAARVFKAANHIRTIRLQLPQETFPQCLAIKENEFGAICPELTPKKAVKHSLDDTTGDTKKHTEFQQHMKAVVDLGCGHRSGGRSLETHIQQMEQLKKRQDLVKPNNESGINCKALSTIIQQEIHRHALNPGCHNPAQKSKSVHCQHGLSRETLTFLLVFFTC